MEYQVKVSKQAEKDILTAKCHYRISGLEKQFDDDFIKQVAYLGANPLLFQIYYRNVRRAHFDSFKYSLHFIVEKKTVFVLRILHYKQKFN